MDIKYALSSLCVCIVFVGYMMSFPDMFTSPHNKKEILKSQFAWILCILFGILFFILDVIYIPLPIFYVLMYIINYFCIQVIRKNSSEKWLLVNFRCLIFTAPHLLLIGVIAVTTKYSLHSVLMDDMLRTWSLIATMFFNILFNIGIRYYLHNRAATLVDYDCEELRLFSRFVWFCTLFVMLDSLLCSFVLSDKLAILFLIGSNILLLMMVVLFARYAYSLAYNTHVKEEFSYLTIEQMKQKNRTKQWEQRAYIDSLTGSYTRRYIVNNLRVMLENKERFILVFIDLDGFKNVNDKNGHLYGDMYLQRFCREIKNHLRPNDIFARLGGDEFLVIMPEISYDEASEKFRQYRSQLEIAFSYGMVSIDESSQLDVESCIAMADSRMYKDKRRHKKAGETR